MVWVCGWLRGLAAWCGDMTATEALEGRVVIRFSVSVVFAGVRQGSCVCEPECSRAVFSPHVPGGKLALGAH